jgi:hypothetical protein
VSFDFEKCSLNSLQNDYPKLFQFDHEQHMYVYIILNRIFYHQFFLERALVPTREKAYNYIETVHTVYYYIRRKAADFIRHKRQLTEIGFAVSN